VLKNQLLIFDLDDTLIDTSDVYWKARTSFGKKLLKEFSEKENIDEKTIINEFERIDSLNMKTWGFNPHRYGKTMFDTYDFFCKKFDHKPVPETLSHIHLCGNIIVNEIPKPINGAKHLLDWAVQQYKLVLITRGEDSFQKLKLNKLGMRQYFSLVEVVSKKDASVFERTLNITGYQSKNTWIIGDSIKSDINPGIQIKANCVLYSYKHPHYFWLQDNESFALGYFYKISKLEELKEILRAPSDFTMVSEV
jgi:putative hydrolase of the HAD superfamily